MNAAAVFVSRQPFQLTVPDFLRLRSAGAFDEYRKAELLDGKLWGVPSDGTDEEPGSGEQVPIRLTIAHYALLEQEGAFGACIKTELVDGVVYPVSPQYRPHGFVKDQLA